MMNSGSDKRHGKTGVAIFASGAGTNAANCIRYFQGHEQICMNLIVTNKPDAGVLKIASQYHIPSRIFLKEDWQHPDGILACLRENHTEFIVLAGFLALLPAALTEAYQGKILNIHPALLPKYGGKGMFGRNVHRAVVMNGETETGITIHEVNEEYDKGRIIFQKKMDIDPADTPETIEKKVRQLEYQYYPVVIESFVLSHKKEIK
jgi:phosphoribosylglycinamide formyltransferase-1